MTERRDITGGYDTDSAVDMVQPHDYIGGMNVRVGRDTSGRGGAGKGVWSTITRLVGDALSGVTRVMGSITEETKSKVFFFKHHDGGNHRIWCLDRRTGLGRIVLQESNVEGGLGFDLDHPVTGLALIGNYLYWTDNLNNPRRVDYERGLKTNNVNYVSLDGTVPVPYTLPLKQWGISVARRVPMYPPKVRQLVSSEEPDIPDRTTNLTKNDSFQFSYRYTYDTGEVSTTGVYSVVVPQNTTDYAQFPLGPTEPRNYDTIRVELDKDEPIDDEVRLIEFMVRRGNSGAWYIVKTFDRLMDSAEYALHNTYGSPELGFYFYNDNIGVVVPDSESYVPFFDVPLLSNVIEIAGGRLFMGNNLKGYDYVSGTDISLTPFGIARPLSGDWPIVATFYLIEWQCGTGTPEVVVMHIDESYGPIAGWYETPYTSAQFNSNSIDLNPSGPYVRYPVIDMEILPTDLIQQLNPTCQDWTIATYPGFAIITDLDHFVETARTFREGVTYGVCIVFYDFAGRNAGTSHSVSTFTVPGQQFLKDSYTMRLDWVLTQGQVPLWAHSYAIARSRTVEPFVAGYVDFVRYGNREDDGSYDFSELTYIDIFEAIGIDWSPMIAAGIGYAYSIGDIMQLIDSDENNYYLEIIGTQGNFIICEIQDIGAIVVGERFYAEIRTPTSEPSDTYWEVGRSYGILDPGSPDRSFSVISGSLFGDTYMALRRVAGNGYMTQAMNPNNKYWQIWPQDYGRPTAKVFSKQRRYETEVAWSGIYFPGTETNLLNQFLSGDIETLDSAMGSLEILKLTSRVQGDGTVMLAIGQTEVASIYLGRREFYNTDETSSLVTTVDVIGNINILAGGYGTVNPESFVENDGNAAWYSAIKGAFVMYSKAGVENISDRKFTVFSTWLGNRIINPIQDVASLSRVRIPGGYDEQNREWLWAIPSIGTWPVAYRVMDIEEDITITESPAGTVVAPLVAGEIYRLAYTAPGSIIVTFTNINDYFFGPKVRIVSGATNGVTFVAAATGNYTFTITSVPAISTVPHTFTLKKLRIDPYNIVNQFPKTVVFSELNGRWAPCQNLTPEWWGRQGDNLLSYRGGVTYSHDSAGVGNFYGVTWPAWMAFAFNQPLNEVKRAQGISLESDVKPSYVHVRTEEPFVQSSDIIASEIETMEGIHSASIKRDRLSPNTAGTVFDKLLKGDEVRGRYFKVLFEWDKNRTFVARVFNFITRNSSGHKI